MPKRLPAITLLRAYDAGPPDAHYRVLVDRLWPRGVKKEDLPIDQWAKDLAPSPELRKWFGHLPERWVEFRKRYREELRARDAAVNELLAVAAEKPVALIFATRDLTHNHANVLLEYLLSKRDSASKTKPRKRTRSDET